MLTTQALIRIVESDLPRLTTVSQRAASAAAEDLRVRGVVAALDSLPSRSLRSMLTVAPDLLAPGVLERFDAVELYGVDSPLILASAMSDGTRRQVVVFNGLIHQIHFFADLISALDGLIACRPAATMAWNDGEAPEAEVFSMAGFSLLSTFVRTGEIPSLIHDMLGPTRRQNVKLGVAASVAFATLHELAHVELGHLDSSGIRNDIGHVGLMEPEPLSRYQAEEFAADRHALALIDPRYRQDIQSSLMFLFGSCAFLEAFSGGHSSHPLAINRLAALAEAADLSPETREIVIGWIQDRSNAFRALAAQRAGAGGDLAPRIEEVMPARRAHAVLAEIKRRVAAEHGLLD